MRQTIVTVDLTEDFFLVIIALIVVVVVVVVVETDRFVGLPSLCGRHRLVELGLDKIRHGVLPGAVGVLCIFVVVACIGANLECGG